MRQNGAVPATIAILSGVPHVGLSREQLEHIARQGTKVSESGDLFIFVGE